jgi:hypothetical protein
MGDFSFGGFHYQQNFPRVLLSENYDYHPWSGHTHLNTQILKHICLIVGCNAIPRDCEQYPRMNPAVKHHTNSALHQNLQLEVKNNSLLQACSLEKHISFSLMKPCNSYKMGNCNRKLGLLSQGTTLR